MPKQSEQIKEYLEKAEAKWKEIQDKLTEFEKKLSELTNKKERIIEYPKPGLNIEPTPNQYPIPTEYRNVVNTVLNQDFNIRIIPLSNSPAFQFEVLVPKEYSNSSENYFETYHEDARPKVITYAEGTPAIKEWCELIWKNLGTDIQAKILMNRKTL